MPLLLVVDFGLIIDILILNIHVRNLNTAALSLHQNLNPAFRFLQFQLAGIREVNPLLEQPH